MNKEIKEILEYFKKYVNDKFETYTVVDRHTNYLKILLDYITNLQQLYDRALTDLVKESHKNMKAVEYIKNINERAYKDDYGTLFSTQDLLEILQGEDGVSNRN